MLIKIFKINVLKEIFSNVEDIDIYFFQAIYKRLFNYYYQTYYFLTYSAYKCKIECLRIFLITVLSRLLRELASIYICELDSM